MPKFIYTFIVSTLVLWVVVLFLGANISPDSGINIFIFLFGLFLGFGMTFTILSFLFFSRKFHIYATPRVLVRKAFKWGFYASFGLTSLLTLKAFDLLTILNTILFLVIYFVLFNQFRSSRV